MLEMVKVTEYNEKNKIDGFNIALQIQTRLAEKILSLKKTYGITPSIIIVMVGDNPASKIYVQKKLELANKLGIKAELRHFPTSIKEVDLLDEIMKINNDNSIHGVIVQMPLPSHISQFNVLLAIEPTKDLDGLNQFNIGLLNFYKFLPYSIGEMLVDDDNLRKFKQLGKTLPFIPCTPLGCIHLLQIVFDNDLQNISGKNAVIIGNSNLVGKPMMRLLSQCGATTTTIHSRSQNFSSILQNADIIVSATGVGQTLKHLKPEAVLIDVGIHFIEGSDKITGDLDYYDLSKTNKITPVPKGVGPMTVVSLMVNAYLSAIKTIK